MKWTWLAFPLLFLLASCKSSGLKPAEGLSDCRSPRFAAVLDSVLNQRIPDSHGHGSFRDIYTQHVFTQDSLTQLIQTLKGFDAPENATCTRSHTPPLERMIWKFTVVNEDQPTYLHKIDFAAYIPLLETGGIANFQITDYEIFRSTSPRHILLRVVLENGFEFLQIDDHRIVCPQESRLAGLDDGITLLEDLKGPR